MSHTPGTKGLNCKKDAKTGLEKGTKKPTKPKVKGPKNKK